MSRAKKRPRRTYDRAPLAALDVLQRYSIPECARYLRVSRSHVYTKIRAGEIQVLKDGGRTFVPGTVIAALSQPTA